MTSRERVLATLRGEPRDRMPFWPKITPSAFREYPEPYRSMTIPELHAFMDTDMLGYTGVPLLYAGDDAYVETRVEGPETIRLYHVGGKTLVGRSLTPEYGDAHPLEYPIKTPEDIETMTRFYEKARWRLDEDTLERRRQKVAANRDTFVFCSLEPTPLMQLCQYECGLQNTVFFLYDYEEEMEALMEAMRAEMRARVELSCRYSPVEYMLNTENTSTTLISPAMFEKYCAPHLADCGRIMEAYGKRQVFHMCGKLKAILPALSRLGQVAMEAFTPPTVGDTSIRDGYESLPGRTIIGGSGAATWLLGEDEIVRTLTQSILEAGGTDRLILSSGGVMPFSASPETIRNVWRRLRQNL